jgi:hypothetical protein
MHDPECRTLDSTAVTPYSTRVTLCSIRGTHLVQRIAHFLEVECATVVIIQDVKQFLIPIVIMIVIVMVIVMVMVMVAVW